MKQKYTPATMEQALNSPKIALGEVYMLVQITGETTLSELWSSNGYLFIEEEDDAPVIVPEKKKEQKKIDVGKINALYDAGWSAAKIADEIGCSSATVYNYLNKKKEETHE